DAHEHVKNNKNPKQYIRCSPLITHSRRPYFRRVAIGSSASVPTASEALSILDDLRVRINPSSSSALGCRELPAPAAPRLLYRLVFAAVQNPVSNLQSCQIIQRLVLLL